jgi:hypothetical protein
MARISQLPFIRLGYGSIPWRAWRRTKEYFECLARDFVSPSRIIFYHSNGEIDVDILGPGESLAYKKIQRMPN